MANGRREFLIWGGGGHGKVVADLIRALGDSVAGFIDRDPERFGQIVEPGGAKVLITEEEFRDGLGKGRLPPYASAIALGVGDNARRRSFLLDLRGQPVPTLIHPSAIVSPSARLGTGTVVLARAVINANSRIGSGAIINSAAVVEHDCAVADAAHLSPGAILGGGVRVAECGWVGIGATVLPGVKIGAAAVVGGGAVVVRDIPPRVVVVGNPARVLRSLA